MAGDWIKVESTTPDKPEVVRMSSLLKIDQDAVVGKLFRVWIWTDQNSVDGANIPVTETFIDRLTIQKGFSAAMRSVGWLTGEDGLLTFPQFDRHNGKTAKMRCATNRRVAKLRDSSVEGEEEGEQSTKEPSNKPKHEAGDAQRVVDAWNRLPDQFPKVKRISGIRRKTITARLSDDWWKENFEAAIKLISESSFLSGGSEKGWVANFDFFLRPESVTKIIEGNYNPQKSGTSSNGKEIFH